MIALAGLIGLPLHPLLVHAVVVGLPLEVLAVLLFQFRPRARRCLGVPILIGAAVLAVVIPLTIVAGEDLAVRIGSPPSVVVHEHAAKMLLPWSIGLAAVILAQQLWHQWPRAAPVGGRGQQSPHRRGATRVLIGGRVSAAVTVVLGVATVIVSVGVIIALVLTGDAGARAVWLGV